jgi:ketol-acid reductoisomerase
MKGTIAVMVKVFHDADADLDTLAGQTIALLGYGIQGRAQAQNLRDSGIRVIVGNRAEALANRPSARASPPSTSPMRPSAATSCSF